jgi:hypothetical protein
LTCVSENPKLLGMEPASTIIEILGGEAKVAEAAGVALTAPYRWQQPRAKGGTGGVIPHWHIAKLLDHARASGVDLTPSHFVPRLPVSDADLPQVASAHS